MYCYTNDWFFSNSVASKTGIAMIIFALVVLVCMILDQVRLFASKKNHSGKTHRRRTSVEISRDWLSSRPSLESYESFVAKRPWLAWTSNLNLDTGPGLLQGLENTLVFATELALLLLTIILLKDYGRILLPTNYVVIDLETWTLGQVIAVTIWLPVLVEFVWDCYGMSVMSCHVTSTMKKKKNPHSHHCASLINT